jgi:hypothetical protein
VCIARLVIPLLLREHSNARSVLFIDNRHDVDVYICAGRRAIFACVPTCLCESYSLVRLASGRMFLHHRLRRRPAYCSVAAVLELAAASFQHDEELPVWPSVGLSDCCIRNHLRFRHAVITSYNLNARTRPAFGLFSVCPPD